MSISFVLELFRETRGRRGALYNLAGKLRLLIRAIDWLLILTPVLYWDEGFEV